MIDLLNLHYLLKLIVISIVSSATARRQWHELARLAAGVGVRSWPTRWLLCVQCHISCSIVTLGHI